VDFSPRIDRRLVEVACRSDVDRLTIAAVWRSVGCAADQLELCRPGYHSVRTLVLDERERRAARREAIAEALAELWSYTGTDYETLVRRLARTARS
jgi:hypothetical protein